MVEKSEWSQEDLRREGPSEGLLAAVDAMTRREEERYREFVLRAAANPLARPVKIADLRDNLALAQSASASFEGGRKAKKYIGALRLLGVYRG